MTAGASCTPERTTRHPQPNHVFLAAVIIERCSSASTSFVLAPLRALHVDSSFANATARLGKPGRNSSHSPSRAPSTTPRGLKPDALPLNLGDT